MKTLRKIDLKSMEAELQVLQQEEERSVLGGTWTMEDFLAGLQAAGYTGSIDLYGDSGSFSNSVYSSGTYMGDGFWSGNYTYHSGNFSSHTYDSGNVGNETVGLDFRNEDLLKDYLCNWVENPYYTEVFLIHFMDGSFKVLWNSSSTPHGMDFELTYQSNSEGNHFFEGKQIHSIGHTQHNTGRPSPKDRQEKVPGFSHFIWFDGHFYSY